MYPESDPLEFLPVRRCIITCDVRRSYHDVTHLQEYRLVAFLLLHCVFRCDVHCPFEGALLRHRVEERGTVNEPHELDHPFYLFFINHFITEYDHRSKLGFYTQGFHDIIGFILIQYHESVVPLARVITLVVTSLESNGTSIALDEVEMNEAIEWFHHLAQVVLEVSLQPPMSIASGLDKDAACTDSLHLLNRQYTHYIEDYIALMKEFDTKDYQRLEHIVAKSLPGDYSGHSFTSSYLASKINHASVLGFTCLRWCLTLFTHSKYQEDSVDCIQEAWDFCHIATRGRNRTTLDHECMERVSLVTLCCLLFIFKQFERLDHSDDGDDDWFVCIMRYIRTISDLPFHYCTLHQPKRPVTRSLIFNTTTPLQEGSGLCSSCVLGMASFYLHKMKVARQRHQRPLPKIHLPFILLEDPSPVSRDRENLDRVLKWNLVQVIEFYKVGGIATTSRWGQSCSGIVYEVTLLILSGWLDEMHVWFALLARCLEEYLYRIITLWLSLW